MDLGIEHLSQGRLEDAATVFRLLLDKGQDPNALHLLGIVRHRQGDIDQAESLIRRAIAAAPDAALFHSTLGVVLAEKDPEASLAAMEKAVSLAPERADLLHNLGLALVRAGRVEEGIGAYQRALAIDVAEVRTHVSLGTAFSRIDKLAEALGHFVFALNLDAGCADARFGVADVLVKKFELDGAKEELETVLASSPDHVASLVLLSNVEVALAEPEQALAHARRAVMLEPNEAAAHAAVGRALELAGHNEAAKEAYARAGAIAPNATEHALAQAKLKLTTGEITKGRIELEAMRDRDPRDVQVLEALAFAYLLEGRPLLAVAQLRRALELEPARAGLRTFMLGMQHYDESIPREQLFVDAIDWGAIVAAREPRLPAVTPDTSTKRKLRIGYVSADFRSHPVGYLMAHLLPHHDKGQFEVTLYSNSAIEDDVTRAIRGAGHAFKPIVSLSNASAAALIRTDAIDVLVDLSGHTGGHRLEVFARKPAPVQATWLGFFGTTGLGAIDYVICDEVVMPQEEERWFVEKPWRISGCYVPLHRLKIAIPISPLPARRMGYVTFGSFNSLSKITDRVIEVWARVLRRVPSSRLVLKTQALDVPEVRAITRERFAKHGMGERVAVSPPSPRNDLLRSYHEVDVALDTFPYNGGMTTIEATYMGVPVVIKRGDRFVSRIGESLARGMGIEELVANDEDAYVDKAVALASDLDALSSLRAELRERALLRSDPRAFAPKLERAFAEMWERWARERGY